MESLYSTATVDFISWQALAQNCSELAYTMNVPREAKTTRPTARPKPSTASDPGCVAQVRIFSKTLDICASPLIHKTSTELLTNHRDSAIIKKSPLSISGSCP